MAMWRLSGNKHGVCSVALIGYESHDAVCAPAAGVNGRSGVNDWRKKSCPMNGAVKGMLEGD